MGLDIRLPNINATSDSGQIAQIKSYLYQFAEQMKWAIDTIDSGKTTNIINSTTGRSVGSLGGSTNTQDSVSNFDAIKALIIKSADIIDAYYEEFNRRISGSYVAQSSFGEYSQKTSQDILETSEKSQKNFENIEKINSDIKTINERLTNAYIKEGHLEDRFVGNGEIKYFSFYMPSRYDTDVTKPTDGIYTIAEAVDFEDYTAYRIEGVPGYWSSPLGYNLTEGMMVKLTFEDCEPQYNGEYPWKIKTLTFGAIIPIYGLEIGQTSSLDGEEVFNKFARFTSDRLSFYDKNDTEVAYISDYKLYITNAEITGTLKLGAYEIDTTNGLAFKWVGRS